MLERVVYVSRAAAGIGLDEVFGIIRAAHQRNAAEGLSGGLVFLDGWFAQVLEGLPAALDACVLRIARDARHENLARDARHGGLRGAGRESLTRDRFSRFSRERAFCRLLPGQPMALRSRSCLDGGLLEAFGYRPGFPVENFPADVLVEFLVQACRPRPGFGLDRRGAVS